MSGRTSEFRYYTPERRGFARPPAPQPKSKRLSLSRGTAIGAAAGIFVLTIWALGATGIIVFRDDVVAGVVRRETSLQYDYEGRIAALKAELSRIQSKQLVDSQAFADKVETLMRRQTSLESRQSIVQSLGEIAASAGIKSQQDGTPAEPEAPADAAIVAQPEPSATPQPLPDSDSIVEVKPGKQARLAIKPTTLASVTGSLFRTKLEGAARQPLSERLAIVSDSIDTVERHQMLALLEIGARAKTRVDRIRDTLDGIGVDPDKLVHKASHNSAEGGPFIPLEPAANASPFESAAYEAQKELATADGYNRILPTIPLRRPFPNAEITSGFGVRVDPFLGSQALHAGIDFRQETGAPVRATASGRVNEAGWVGGYGNMVEIDHGNGLSTRFGHMSQILVTPGETVAIGQIIGRVGSTGRSTGPHLHYETRIGGVAVDPLRFLRAEKAISGAS